MIVNVVFMKRIGPYPAFPLRLARPKLFTPSSLMRGGDLMVLILVWVAVSLYETRHRTSTGPRNWEEVMKPQGAEHWLCCRMNHELHGPEAAGSDSYPLVLSAPDGAKNCLYVEALPRSQNWK